MGPKVVVIVEGRTEAEFVKKVLGTGRLVTELGVSLPPITYKAPTGSGSHSTTFPNRRSLLKAVRDARSQGDVLVVTTLFDLYGIRGSTSGGVSRALSPTARAEEIEKSLKDAVAEQEDATGRSLPPFIPYIQVHEFEALLFSDRLGFDSLSRRLRTRDRDALGRLIDACQISPETINGGDDTHPSARIKAAFPDYDKVLDGVDVATEVGLDRMRQRCPRFGAWLARLESIAGG